MNQQDFDRIFGKLWSNPKIFYLGMLLFGHEKARKTSFQKMKNHGITSEGIEKILDVGCGTGLNFPYFQKNFSRAKVHAFDYNPRMVLTSLEKSVEMQINHGYHVSVKQANALHMPYKTNSMDMAYLGFVLSSFPEPEKVMLETIRVTKPGAPIIITGSFESEFKPVRWLEKNIMQRFLEKFGWLTTKPIEKALEETGLIYHDPIFTDHFKTLRIYYCFNENERINRMLH